MLFIHEIDLFIDLLDLFVQMIELFIQEVELFSHGFVNLQKVLKYLTNRDSVIYLSALKMKKKRYKVIRATSRASGQID